MSAAPHANNAAADTDMFRPRLGVRRLLGAAFFGFCVLMCLLAVLVLAILLISVVRSGWPMLTWDFLKNLPSQLMPETAGIYPALWGSLWLMALTLAVAVPVGVGAAIYLEEYATRNVFTRFISLNISNLAGVPSIVYGMLGLALFVRGMQLGQSVLAGALTLSLLILPVVIIASREALAAVPNSIRQAAYALGATRWQIVWAHVLPSALPGILTGIILSLSRAIGETAPLIMIAALTWITTVPGELALEDRPFWRETLADGAPAVGWLQQVDWTAPLYWTQQTLTSEFTAMPIQIYNWIDQPQPEFHTLAAAGIVVLLAILLTMNALAIGIRAWRQKHKIT